MKSLLIGSVMLVLATSCTTIRKQSEINAYAKVYNVTVDNAKKSLKQNVPRSNNRDETSKFLSWGNAIASRFAAEITNQQNKFLSIHNRKKWTGWAVASVGLLSGAIVAGVDDDGKQEGIAYAGSLITMIIGIIEVVPDQQDKISKFLDDAEMLRSKWNRLKQQSEIKTKEFESFLAAAEAIVLRYNRDLGMSLNTDP